MNEELNKEKTIYLEREKTFKEILAPTNSEKLDHKQNNGKGKEQKGLESKGKSINKTIDKVKFEEIQLIVHEIRFRFIIKKIDLFEIDKVNESIN